jgi:hypothetical protein
MTLGSPNKLSGDDIPSTTGTAGKAGSGRDVSLENSPSFDLMKMIAAKCP